MPSDESDDEGPKSVFLDPEIDLSDFLKMKYIYYGAYMHNNYYIRLSPS